MSKKKKLGAGIDALFAGSGDRIKNATAPRKKTEIKNSREPVEFERTTVYLIPPDMEKLKAFGYTKRIPIAVLLRKAVREFLDSAEVEKELDEALNIYRSRVVIEEDLN